MIAVKIRLEDFSWYLKIENNSVPPTSHHNAGKEHNRGWKYYVISQL